ncbi:MAG: IS481 family transposase [Acidimicrobiia bacterium]
MVQATAKLTPFGRRLLVDRILVGRWTVPAAAESVGVSRQTAYRWLRRFREEGAEGLADRSSRPRSCPTRLPVEVEQLVVADRAEHREGPHLMAARLGMSRSTIYKVLRRRGLSRLSYLDKPTGIPIRYVKDHPGELVHIDIKKLAKIPDGGGWRGRSPNRDGARANVGYEYAHTMIDDHSRVAYTEILDHADAEACTEFLIRAAAWFATLGYRIDRVMTDNAKAYLARDFQTAVDTIGAVHKRTRPYRPQTNGKVERFHQTLLKSWAYKRRYTTNTERTTALTEFLHTYNHQRPHSALGGQPPMTILVNHLCGNDT